LPQVVVQQRAGWTSQEQPLALAVAQGELREVAPEVEVPFETLPQVAALSQVAVSGSLAGPPFPEKPLTLLVALARLSDSAAREVKVAVVLVPRWDASVAALVGASAPQVALVALLASVEEEAGPVSLL
jgi:hypothetical protein